MLLTVTYLLNSGRVVIVQSFGLNIPFPVRFSALSIGADSASFIYILNSIKRFWVVFERFSISTFSKFSRAAGVERYPCCISESEKKNYAKRSDLLLLLTVIAQPKHQRPSEVVV